ncbi:MAG: Hpt domain-containing protein, partial [Lachnospiraceae bacterium]|nr:Hpt domain-containing protein [Lachnospiraceae bacterium]
ANSTDDARNLFMEHSFSDYMSKPIEKEILTDMLYKWLPKTKIIFKEYDMKKESFIDKFTIAFEKAGINIDKGLSYTGDNMDMYITVLKTLYKESENYMSNLKNALDTHNMHDYGICIHSIKGALASIGAAALSELALELELKAKAGDDAFIVANHNAFVIKFEKIINDINQIIISYDLDNSKREKKTKENLSHNEMNKNLIAVAENIKDYEIDEATKILNNLQTYNLDNSLEELISDILEKIDNFDYELAVSLIENRTGQK